MKDRRAFLVLLSPALVVAALLISCSKPAEPEVTTPHVAAKSIVEAGRYIVLTAGCNDCHTPGWEQGSNIPEEKWLLGDRIGFRGPWGTSYPSNLRLTIKPYNQQSFVQAMKTRNGRPPMPWASLHHMSDEDLAALYNFIASLGPAGEPAPPAVSPDNEPLTAYIDMRPQISTKASPAPQPPATFPR